HILKRADKLIELRVLLEHIPRNSPHLPGMSYDFDRQLADSGQYLLVGGHFALQFSSCGLHGIALSQRGLKSLREMSNLRLTVFQLRFETCHDLFAFPASILKVPNRLNPRRDCSETECGRTGKRLLPFKGFRRRL